MIGCRIALRRLLHALRELLTNACKERPSCFDEIGDPIADVSEIRGYSRNHLHGHAAPFDILEPICERQQLPCRQVCFDRILDLIDDRRYTREDLRRKDLHEKCPHEMLLTRNASDVSFAVAIAHVLDRLCPVHMLHAGLEINDEPAVIVPRILIVHPLFHVNINAAHGIDDPLKRRRVDQDVVRDGNPHEFLDGSERHLVSTECIGMVDLVVTVAADFDARITRDGEQCRPFILLINGSEHERIAAPDIICPSVNAHEEDIPQIVLGQIGKAVHAAQRSRHEIAAKIVNRADE